MDKNFDKSKINLLTDLDCKSSGQSNTWKRLRMEPIDQPFRFSWDFCVVWLLLTIPTLILVLSGHWNFGPWYSNVAFVLVVPFIATFFVYGPVLFMRQIIRSGSYGWFVFRVFLTTVLVIGLFFGILYISGHGKDVSGLWGGVAAFVAVTYLHQRLRR